MRDISLGGTGLRLPFGSPDPAKRYPLMLWLAYPTSMKLDEQQRLQIFCAALQGVAADMTHMVKPEKVVETAIELAEQAIAAIMSGEHF